MGAPVSTSIFFTDDGKVGAQHIILVGASCRPQSVGQNRKCDGISNTWKLTYPRLHQSAGNFWCERSNDLLFVLPYQSSPGLVHYVPPAGPQTSKLHTLRLIARQPWRHCVRLTGWPVPEISVALSCQRMLAFLLQLIRQKCMPILLYGLDVCSLSKRNIQSLNFTVNRVVRVLMKLFKTSNIDTTTQWTIKNVTFYFWL